MRSARSAPRSAGASKRSPSPTTVAAAITGAGRPSRRSRRLRRAVERDRRGPADRFVRGSAGHLPERRRGRGDPRARPGGAGHRSFTRAGRRPTACATASITASRADGGRRAADGRCRRPSASCSRPTPSRRTGRSCSRRGDPRTGRGARLGLVNADIYRVRDGEIVAGTVAPSALSTVRQGGRRNRRSSRRGRQGRVDGRAGRAARELGRRIEAHFGCPQDIEWCLVGDDFQIVQSRPITTLFPVPAAGDDDNHVYVSVGHQQMMTDPMKPLGLSVWKLTRRRRCTTPAGACSSTSRGPWRRRPAAPASWRPGEVRSTHPRRAGDHRRPRRLRPAAPGRRAARARCAAGWRRARSDRDRSGDRHRADRARRGLPRRPAARHPVEAGRRAVRLHSRGHPGGAEGGSCSIRGASS